MALYVTEGHAGQAQGRGNLPEGHTGQAQGQGQPPRGTCWVALRLPWGDTPVKPRGPRAEVQGLRGLPWAGMVGVRVLGDGAERS